jgi:hypothetical protein
MGVMATDNEKTRPSKPVERGRWTSQRKMEVVLRLLRGEDLDVVSRELKLKTSRLAKWRDDFLASGQTGLKSRKGDHRDEENARLKSKVGELTMEIELLNEKIERLEEGLRPRKRRPKW